MLEFDPLDEYPIHQVPLPMRYVGPSDRHFYDRCIYQGVDHEADAFFITGIGVYPNLGVIDAYATVRRGDRQWAVRMSGARPDDKMQPAGRPVSHRGRRAVPRGAHRLRRRRARHRLRPHLHVASTDRSPSRSTSAARATASCSTHRASRASAHGRASCASTATRSRSTPERFTATATVRGASARSANPSRRDARTSSTGCGGTGSRCASTTSRCT